MAGPTADTALEHAAAELIAAAAEPLPDIDDPAFASALRPLRRRARRAARRGEPRHLRILSRPRGDHPAADRAARLHYRRGRGRLAGRRDASTATSATGRSARARTAAVPALPDLDVAQHARSTPSSAGCASTMQGRAYEQMAGFYGLDLYNLGASIRAVIDFLDEADPEAASVARERYGCLTPWSRDPADLRAAWRSPKAMRRCEAGAVADAPRPAQAADGLPSAEECDEWLDAAANARLVKNAEAYYRVMYYGSAESWNLRDTHMFETLVPAARGQGAGARRRWSGRITAISATRRITEMGMARERAQHRPAGQGEVRRRGAADRLRHPHRHRRRGERLGRADGGQAGAPVAARKLRAAVPRQRRRRASCSTCARARSAGAARSAARAAARALHRRHLPARDRALEPLFARRSCRKQFDAWVWFDETTAVTPLPGEHGRARTRPIRSGCKRRFGPIRFQQTAALLVNLGAEQIEAEIVMPHRRKRSTGSFRDYLGGVIARFVPDEPKSPARPRRAQYAQARPIPANMNSRLFERVWRKED